MLGRLLDSFFGCWHRNYCFPISVRAGQRRTGAAALTGTYVVCLDCGREFPYDWNQLKVVSPSHKPAAGIAEPVQSYASK
ncbi:MAG TPA: hypothetical protein VK473_04120 [Terriglobales bacterium]|nr:hypothetical protein [Terriglobales bacterium]